MADFPLGGYTYIGQGGADESLSVGEVVTSGGGGSKGSWVELIASTPKKSDLIILSMAESLASSAMKNLSFDIAVGPVASEHIIVEDLHGQIKEGLSPVFNYNLPVAIAEGSRISVRLASNSATQSCTMIVQLFAATFTSPIGRAKTTAYGVSGTSGTAVDPGGTINTKGSWVEVSASTANSIASFNICIDGNTNTAQAEGNFLFDIGVGGSGSEEIILENMHISSSSFEAANPPIHIQQVIPAGSRIAIRTQSDIADAADRVLSFSINGVN